MYRLGVATSAELEALRVYFDSVAVEADKLQQQWAARNDPVWVVVSSPEFLHTGERVMEWIQEACERQPWRLNSLARTFGAAREDQYCSDRPICRSPATAAAAAAAAPQGGFCYSCRNYRF